MEFEKQNMESQGKGGKINKMKSERKANYKRRLIIGNKLILVGKVK